MQFSCYGDREGDGVTIVRTHPTRVGVGGFRARQFIDMDCRGERGGLVFLNVNNRRTNGDDDSWGWRWTCADGTSGASGPIGCEREGTKAAAVTHDKAGRKNGTVPGS